MKYDLHLQLVVLCDYNSVGGANMCTEILMRPQWSTNLQLFAAAEIHWQYFQIPLVIYLPLVSSN